MLLKALEVSYYIEPQRPGLTRDQLLQVGANSGLFAGEMRDSLEDLLESGQIDRSGHDLLVLGQKIPYHAFLFDEVQKGTPRSPEAHRFMHDYFIKHRREHGRAEQYIDKESLLHAARSSRLEPSLIEIELAILKFLGTIEQDGKRIRLVESRLPLLYQTGIAPQLKISRAGEDAYASILALVRSVKGIPGGAAMDLRCRFFVSHYSEDRALASAVVEFIKRSIVVSSNAQILCTSVVGHELVAGDDPQVLRNKLHETDVVIGLITPGSLVRPFVLMEFGAAWALSKVFIPLLFSGADFSQIPSWIMVHGYRLDDSLSSARTFMTRLSSLAERLAQRTGLPPRPPSEVSGASAELFEVLTALIKPATP